MFLESEYSSENIKFFLEVEQFRQTDNFIDRIKKADHIRTKYMLPDSKHQINISSNALKTIESELLQCEKDLFDKVQKEIYKLMELDSFLRFLNSEYYKKYLEKN